MPLTVTSCDDLPARIADAVQNYVDSFADVQAEDVAAQSATGLDDFAETTANLRSQGEQLGCDPSQVSERLRQELTRVTGGTPVQDAVLATFVADPLGTVDPSDPRPVDIEVSTTNDLVAALSLAGSGSTIRIAPGDYVVGEPLVALRPVTLVGSGAGQTVIRSIAPGAGLLIDADGDVAVRDLTLRHEGTASASVLIVTGGGYDLEGLTLSGGVAGDGGAGGFGLILRTSDNPVRAAGSVQRVSDVDLVDHDGGGIFIGDDAAPGIDSVTVEATGGCGLCFVDSAAGQVSSGIVVGVPIGVRVDDDAAPELSGLRIRRGQIGVALTGSGSPTIVDTRIVGATTGVEGVGSGAATLATVEIRNSRDIAVRIADSSALTVRDVSMNGRTTVGIGVADSATPVLQSLTIDTTGDVGVIWAGDSAGTARDLRVSGSRLGLQLSDAASPVVSDVRVRSAEQAALLATGASAGSITRLRCPDGIPVALVDETSVDIRQSPSCAVAEVR